MPAAPTLLLAGRLAMRPQPRGQVLPAAVLASVLADTAWYSPGRAFGDRVLSGLCTLTIHPASCVSQTEARFVRWGLPSLVVAKFFPGFSAVAPSIDGGLRMPIAGLVLAAGVGALLWAGLAQGTGWLVRGAVPGLIAALDRHGGCAAAGVAAALGSWLAWKLLQRRRFRRLSAFPYVTAAKLRNAMATEQAVRDWPKHRALVTLCACPQEAGAVEAAQRLLAQGYLDVRPLKGGYDSWIRQTA